MKQSKLQEAKVPELKASLVQVREAAHEQYPRNRGRLAQLDSALATASMALDALEDEEARHADLADRIASDESAAERHRHQLNNLHPEYRVKGA